MQPDASVLMAAKRVGGLLGVIDIAQHDGRTRDADLAFEVRVQLFGGAGLDDLVIRIGEGDADGADTVIVLRGQAACRDALGQTVALADLHGGIVRLEEVVDLLLELNRQAVAAAEHALEAAEVRAFQLVRAQQRLKERRNAGDDVGLLLDEKLCIRRDVELRHQNAARAANQRGVNADAQTEAVEHGHDGEHLEPVDGGKTGRGNGLQAQRVEVHIGQQDALRGAGGAARVENRSALFGLLGVLGQEGIQLLSLTEEVLPPDVIAFALGVRVLPAGSQSVADGKMREQFIFDLCHDQLRLKIVELWKDRGNLAVELVERQNRLGLREVQIELDFARRGQGMDHVGDGADAVERVEAVDRLRAVRHADGDAVALLDAQCEICLCGGVDFLHELGIRRLFAHELIGVVLGILVGSCLDHFIDGLLRIFQMLRRVAVILEPGSGRGNAHLVCSSFRIDITPARFARPQLYRNCRKNATALRQFPRLAWNALLVEQPRNDGARDAHCALRAELLTAEAVDARLAVDDGELVLHRNCLCRTDLCALAAADAAAFF